MCWRLPDAVAFAKQPKVVLFGDDVPYTSTSKPKRLELKVEVSRNAGAVSRHTVQRSVS